MAFAATSTGELLDLSFLTEEEVEKIRKVLKADEELRTRDRIRLGTLRQEVEQERRNQQAYSGNTYCSCCRRPFGVIFNRGAPCPDCNHKVCKQCRRKPFKTPPAFVCTICSKQRLLDLQSKEYASPSLPYTYEPSVLYGSELVRKSLVISSSPSGSRSPSPYPQRTKPHPLTVSTASSIVVKYTNVEDGPPPRSLSLSPTPQPVSMTKEKRSSSSARRVSPSELSGSDIDDDEEEDEVQNETHLTMPSMDYLKRSDSIGSMSSMYSASCGKGNYDITGELNVGVWYKNEQLYVRIVKAKGIAAAKKGNTSDPYVKSYLLPDKSKRSKRKTGILRKTTNPVYNELLKYKLPQFELQLRTLWLSVWDYDRFGRNNFLGEVRIPLANLDLTDSKDRWHTLQDKADGDDQMYRGRLKVGLMFSPRSHSGRQLRLSTPGTLYIMVKQAEELPIMDEHALTDATVKLYLLPNRNTGAKRKTKVIKGSINPVWEEQFEYQYVTFGELKTQRILEVTVWDFDRRGSNDFIGGLYLGPTGLGADSNSGGVHSVGEEVSHWEAALDRPGEWVEQWHTLRPSMDPNVGIPSSRSSSPRGHEHELSPVAEMSPSHELIESTGGGFDESLPVVEGSYFSPPPFIPPSPRTSPQVPELITSPPVIEVPEPATSPPVIEVPELTTSPPVIEVPEPATSPPVIQVLEPTSPELEEDELREEVVETTPTSWEATPTSFKEATPPIAEVLVSSDKPSTNLKHHDSISSLIATKGDYDIIGEVLVGINYKGGQLLIHVDRARGLAAADSNGLSDPYVKTYLLPDTSKSAKRKTKIRKKTLNPVYDETLKYKVAESELESLTIWLSVWDHDTFGRNQFLGEVRLPVSHIDLSDPMDLWYTLYEKDEGRLEELPLEEETTPLSPDHEAPLSLDDEFKKTPLQPAIMTGASSNRPDNDGNFQSEEFEVICEPSKTAPQEVKAISEDLSKVPNEPVGDTVMESPTEDGWKQTSKIVSVRQRPVITSKTSEKKKEQEIEDDDEFATMRRISPVLKDAPVGFSFTEPSPSIKTTQLPPLPPSTDKPTTTTMSTLDSGAKKRQFSHSPLFAHKTSHTSLGSTSSFGSMGSVYSYAGTKGDYDCTGSILLGVYYEHGSLEVHINRARGLAAANKSGFSDPYVKTYLLPDKSKHSKQKTSIKKRTLDPVYNETLKYKLPKSELVDRTLWVSVWDFDRFGRNRFLGEVRVPLASVDSTDAKDHWYPIQEKDESSQGEVDDFYRGELQVALAYKPREKGKKDRGTLEVLIKQGKELPLMDSKGTNGVVKLYLLPNRSTTGKRKTGVIKNNLNPVWDETFTFENVSIAELSSQRVLEVTVWDHDKNGNDFIGGLRLGPPPGRAAKHKDWMDSIGEEVSHWEAMVSHPGEWIEEWHTLRSTMEPRNIDLSSYHTYQQEQEEEQVVVEFAPVPFALDDEFKKISPKGTQRTSPSPPRVTKQSSPLSGVSSPESGSRESTPSAPAVVHREETSHLVPAVIVDVGSSRESLDSLEEHEPKHKGATTPHQPSPALLGLHGDDFGSMASVYSAAGGKGDYDIIGEVLVGVHYKGGQLLIHVDRARGLAAADSNGLSDPYVKTYLLPDKSKHSKKKTDIKKKTLNPIYNQTLKYKVNRSIVDSCTVWLSVWDWDRFGRNQFLGEIHLPVLSLDLSDSTDHWYILQDKDEDSAEGETSYKGQVNLALMFTVTESKKKRTKGTLSVAIKQARDLPKMESKNGQTDSFVKSYLLPDRSSSGKRKTSVIKNNLNPVWEEKFTFEKVTLEELSKEKALEVTIWDFTKGSGNDFIGGIRLSPPPGRDTRHKDWMDAIGEEVSHWEAALAHPGEWVEQWHTLRPSMDPRKVSYET